MRAQFVAVAAGAAVLAGAGVLLVSWLAGWHGHTRTRTIVVSAPAPQRAVPTPAVPSLPAGRFDPEALYAARSGGVVTIYSTFAGEEEQGSGFVVSRDGIVLTNSHVVLSNDQAASALAVRFADGDRIPASIVGYDVFDDVGVIRVDPHAHGLAPLPLGSSAAVEVGEPVAVIGSPFGNENSLTVGIVS